MLTRAVMGHGGLLLHHHRIGAAGARTLCQHSFLPISRASPASSPSMTTCPTFFLLRGRRLLYSWGIYVLVALTAAALIIFGGVTDRLHSALRCRRIHGLHALASRNGDATGSVRAMRRFACRQRLGSRGHGYHCRWLVLVRQIRTGRMDHRAPDCRHDPLDARPSHRHYVGVDRDHCSRPAHRSGSDQPTHRGAAHRPLRPDYREALSFGARHVLRYSLRARADRRRAGPDLPGMGD